MEWINFLVILIANLICIIWSLQKRHEINTTKVTISDDVGFTTEEKQQKYDEIFYGKDDLVYVAATCQKVIDAMLARFHKYMLVVILIGTLLVYLFLEENYKTFSMPLLFFLGSYSQVLNIWLMFRNYGFFDPRIIFINRASPKHALEFLIKVNSYITMTNQAINLGLFVFFYIPSAWIFLGNTASAKTKPTAYFEYFHRKFLSYGLGTVFSYFVTRSMSHLFCQGSRMVYEILHRDKGIPNDHPRNPARIVSNISESFWRVSQNMMEYNALTTMGLCLFQDFFVIKYVYVYDRGFLNGLAIYSIGMVGSLISMINFRHFSFFKHTQSRSFFSGVKTLRISGLKAMLLSAAFVLGGSFLILLTYFPDSVAVYNPFRRNIAMRGVTYIDTFIIIAFSFLINLSLVLNSIFFTDPLSIPNRSVENMTQVSLSHTILNSVMWSGLGTVIPMAVFLTVVILSYMYANVFGISINYLGCITFYQITQFFQNFKAIQNFYTTILMMNKDRNDQKEMQVDLTFVNLNRTCTFYGKFSTGAGLFIVQILLFTILVDCVNMNIVQNLIVIDPYYVIAIFYGCLILNVLGGLEVRLVEYFVQVFINRIREFVMERLEEKRFEPPILEMCQDLTRVSFIRLTVHFVVPVCFVADQDLGRDRILLLGVWRQDHQHRALRFVLVGAIDLLSDDSAG